MKITDIIDKLPCKVKLNENFQLTESFDKGTIVFIESCQIDTDDCYELHVLAMKEDLPHNISVAIRNWYDKNGGPTLNIFQANPERFNSEGNFEDTIFVMENDDCFDLVEPKLTIDSKMVSDIEKLIDGIMSVAVQTTGDYGRGGECPYCRKSCAWNDSMFDVEHESNCTYVLAQELSKRFNNC